MFVHIRILTTLLLILMGTSASAFQLPTPPQLEEFYVGTYTDLNSEGIYRFALDHNGKVKSLGLVAREENPSFLAKTADGKYLLAVNENSDQKNNGGTVASFAIVKDSLQFLSRRSSGGDAPCHIALDDQGQLLVSNYLSGTIALLKIKKDGKLEGPADVSQHQGSGPDPRQEGPHAHSAWFHEKRNQVIGVDLGTDQLWLYDKNKPEEQTKLNLTGKITLPAGSGPRHLAIHPDQQWLYVINELNSTITRLEQTGDQEYHIRETVSTLPGEFEGENYCADIRISSDGKFLYGSNRGHNSIVIYQVDQTTGQLYLLDHQHTQGNWPRNFTLSPGEDFLLVANQNSNSIVSFKRNPSKGTLEFTDKATVPSPVCLLF
ncbi:lactonase family protein [Zeaxanthinibacter sp. PT1]|uniref:lactonase family protein n=1 Tax=Zeaxanthinibacter TaxID=561554 RepID=UPI0023498C97|nr:lactonase family protein [Zeaxanthinibacter sp. PT1]MDC6351268.1 lactonase family protein [Zeaxanthinibacter sp. PT1]